MLTLLISTMGRRRLNDIQDFGCRNCRIKWSEFIKKNTPCRKSLYKGRHNFDFSKPIYLKVVRVDSVNKISKKK